MSLGSLNSEVTPFFSISAEVDGSTNQEAPFVGVSDKNDSFILATLRLIISRRLLCDQDISGIWLRGTRG